MPVECDRFLTDDDFRRIKKLRRKELLKKQLKKFAPELIGTKANAVPEFDLLAQREALKRFTIQANDASDEEDIGEVNLNEEEDKSATMKKWER